MNQLRDYTERPSITIDGVPLERALEAYLERVVVDDHVHLPDTFAITLRDPTPAKDVLSRARAAIGSVVRIGATPKGGLPTGPGSEDLLIHGEVTALEGEYEGDASRLVIRGYDASHRLMGGRRTEAYANVTDGDVATRIAQRAGIGVGQIDDPGTPHDHVSQSGLSDWDFLRSRAQELGYDVAVVDGKLDFRAPRAASEAPPEGDYRSTDPRNLVRGKNLLRFYPRVTAAEQVQEVQVRGWDPKTKEPIVATASAATTSAEVSGGSPAELARTVGRERLVVAGRPFADQAAADRAAAAAAEQIGSGFTEAEGVAVGHPILKPGTAVHVSGVAEAFTGRFTLTNTRHVFDEDGYRTHFTISGRQNRSLLGLVAGAATGAGNGPSVGASPAALAGLAVAVVTEVEDPEAIGRVRLEFPTLDAQYVSDWARVVQPGAGDQRGMVILPEVGDEVLVGFESGDLRRPYVLGGLYNGRDKPWLGDALFDNGSVLRRGFVSRAGHRLVFLDDAERSKSGIALVTTDDALRIALKHSDRTISIGSSGDVTIEADGDISVVAKGDLSLEGQGNVRIRAGRTVDIDGAMIELN